MPTLLAVMSKDRVPTTAGPHHFELALPVTMPRGSVVFRKQSRFDRSVSW
jgi:hypothetical protein